jgi:BolA protein
MSSETNHLRMKEITNRLTSSLNPSDLTVLDESHLHAGHAGAKTGKGHFAVTISSSQFEGLLPLKRHRLVYQALGDLMDTDIHAIRIKARC